MTPRSVAAAAAALVAVMISAPLAARAAPVLLNEYNAVADGEFLNGGTVLVDDDGGLASDVRLGRVPSNGGDWFELVVVEEEVDLRGWKLEIHEGSSIAATLVLTQDPLWTTLRAGSFITVSDSIAEDVIYDPEAGDWWVNVRAADDGSGSYVSPVDFPVSHED